MSTNLTRGFKRKFPHVVAAIRYAEDVVAKKVPAGLYVRQACERQLADLDREFNYVFDCHAAEKVCRFVERLPHIKGEWASKGLLLRLEPWQCFNLTTVFGWVRRDDVYSGKLLVARAGTRRFKTAYTEIPRKNAKSTTAAGVGLYMLAEDGEHGAEIYSAATTRDQAKILFDVAREMAKRTPGLGLGVGSRRVYQTETASYFAALHAQGNTLDGYNVHCSLNDEVHAWQKRAVYDVIETAMGARAQPLIYNITTAGANLEGICFELRGYGIRILNGAVQDDSFFAAIYTIDEEDKDNWQDPAVWQKANPNWGVSVYPWALTSIAKKAAEIASETNGFLTKHLDVWVNAAVAWMDMAKWQRCFDTKMSLADFKGVPCYAGLDLASKIDVNSLATVFEVDRAGTKHYYVFMRHWLPEAAIKADRFGQYDGWVRMGAITKTPGNVIDTSIIEGDIIEQSKAQKLVEMGIDPLHNSTQVGVNVAKAGVQVVDVRPTVMNFSEPMKWLEAWVADGTLHFCDPVLTWMVSNVVAHRDQKDNIYPRKESVTRKIDGLVALLIAINRLKSGAEEAPTYQMLFV